MGKSKAKYHLNLHQQVEQKFSAMLHAGEGTSKRAAIADGSIKDKIFSYETYRDYKKHMYHFADWLKASYPDITSLKQGKKHVKEYLQMRSDFIKPNGKPLSRWTIIEERQAINKFYGIRPGAKEFFEADPRRRVDIERSRSTDNTNRKHFSEANNRELVEFAKGTGCRRGVLERLEGKDLKTREEIVSKRDRLIEKGRPSLSGLSSDERKQLGVLSEALRTFSDKEYFVLHRNDKGGRTRLAPIIGTHTDEIVARMRNTPAGERVWASVPVHMDVHGYRAEYATILYKEYARPIDQIPRDKVNAGTGRKYQSDVYACRGDEKGRKLDKIAMMKVSLALGHSRIEVVSTNYLRNL